MKKMVCEQCGKVIEGYNDNHVEHLMQQHQLKHDRENNKIKKEVISR